VQVIAIAACTNVACALLGCYLVLRRMSLLGDALSHAVLPGLVVAFLLSGSLGIGFMFLGALIVGLLTTFLTQLIHRQGNVPADAAMGVVFTSLFALGVALINRYASDVHIDTQCVLEGLLEFVGLPGTYSIRVAGVNVPRQFFSVVPVLIVNLLFVLLFWKELLISSFDPALATTMGIRAGVMHYALMALVALTTVASFEVVGSILVVAMLIAPPAAAQLLTDRLGRMLLIASGIGVATAFGGYFLAVRFDTNTAGMMAVLAGVFYALAVLLAPRYGLLGALVRNMQMSLRVLSEDLLAMLYRLEELAIERRLGAGEAARAVGGGLLARVGVWRLRRRGKIEKAGGGLQLTPAGRADAQKLVRGHRLWEAYLVEHLGLPHDHVHGSAERMEHYIGEGLRDRIARDLPETITDPHGREIPRD
jgi:ABC-type Mn2+/Zn2+ transport system permease subunit